MNNSHIKYQSIYQDMQNNPQLLDSLEHGSMPLLHIENHQFRDRIKSAELSKKGNIYLQHYLPADQRAAQTQTQFKSGHLKEDNFDQNLPHKNHSFWLKVRQIPKEGPSLRFGLKKRTENERITEHVSKGDGYLIDHTKKDTKMIHYPDWKPIQKQNWVGTKNIDTTTCLYQGPKSNPPWQQLPLRHNHEGAEYIDGLEKVGEKIHRFREKKKEVNKLVQSSFLLSLSPSSCERRINNAHNRPDFITTAQSDAMGQTLHISQSLRTFKSHKVLGVDQTAQEFSKTKKLSYYKQPLIETKSVDHQIPYLHSQSIRSQPVRDLMPTTDKVYKLSVKQFMIDSAQQNLNHSHQQFENFKPDLVPMGDNMNGKQSQFKELAKGIDGAKFGFGMSNPISQKNSRGSQRTTQYSWNKSRAQTAASAKRRSLADMSNLKQKLQNDPYYQPTTQETKNLVKKYFD